MSVKHTIHRLFSKAEVVIPTEFYDVREETTPKAGWGAMFGLTSLVYIAAVVAFANLFTNEAKKSTVETIITSSNLDGQDDYTCQMISKVSATYNYVPVNNSQLNYAYDLVSVIETEADCQNNLAAADPCGEPLTYFPGTSTVTFDSSHVIGAGVMYGNRSSIVWDTADGYPLLTNYDYTSGQTSNILIVKSGAVTASLAVDVDGYCIYIRDNNGDREVYRAATTANASAPIFALSLDYNPVILNDNLYNIYLLQNNTFVYMNIYDNNPQEYNLFSISATDAILCAAVYHNGVSPRVYYSTRDSPTVVYSWSNGVTETKSSTPFAVKYLTVDAADNLYILLLDHLIDEFCLKSSTSQDFMYVSVGTNPPSMLAVNPSGQRIITSYSLASNVPVLAFAYTIDTTFQPPQLLEVQTTTNSAAGWFVCGDQLLNSTTMYTPTQPELYSQSCKRNGIVGAVKFINSYTSTSLDASAYFTAAAAPFCTELYAPITEYIADLPPYSCSRTLHPGFFSCLATAFANTTALVQILVFAFALLLPKLAKMYPATFGVAETSSNPTETNIELTTQQDMQNSKETRSPMA